MFVFIGECYEFGFNRRTVSWTCTLNLSVKQWRVGNTLVKLHVRFGGSVKSPTWQLFERLMKIHIAELMEVEVAILFLHFIEMHRTFIYSYGCSCFHSIRTYTQLVDTFSEMGYGRLCTSTSREGSSSDVH